MEGTGTWRLGVTGPHGAAKSKNCSGSELYWTSKWACRRDWRRGLVGTEKANFVLASLLTLLSHRSTLYRNGEEGKAGQRNYQKNLFKATQSCSSNPKKWLPMVSLPRASRMRSRTRWISSIILRSECGTPWRTPGRKDKEKGKGRNGGKELLQDIRENEPKINLHGKRADAIVKSMLQHSRASGVKKEPTDINALCNEYLRWLFFRFQSAE